MCPNKTIRNNQVELLMKLVVKDDGGKDGDYVDTPAVAERVWTASASEREEIYSTKRKY